MMSYLVAFSALVAAAAVPNEAVVRQAALHEHDKEAPGRLAYKEQIRLFANELHSILDIAEKHAGNVSAQGYTNCRPCMMLTPNDSWDPKDRGMSNQCTLDDILTKCLIVDCVFKKG